jgi:DNA-binding MurR/RpiR family transcriptional regulator
MIKEGNMTGRTKMSDQDTHRQSASGPAQSVNQTLQDRIAAGYAGLSTQLRRAADYVAAHPMDVASRSLRAISVASELPPATYSRLARALGFDGYEQMRELCRLTVEQRVDGFADKAKRLGQGDSSAAGIIERQTSAVIANIQALQAELDPTRMEAAANALGRAGRVVLFGAYGSTGIVEYLAYLAHYSRGNWMLAGRMGGAMGASLVDMKQGDVLLVVTKSPYARRSIAAVDLARQQGAQTIIITDSHSCPAIAHADFAFIVPSDSPQFFSSYAATLTLLECLMALVVSRDPEGSSQRIREIEQRNDALGEFWSDGGT